MHELSIASALFDIIKEEMQKRKANRLISAKVRCGVLSGVVPDALAFGFEAITKNTALEGAHLEIIEEPLKLECINCRTVFFAEAVRTAVFAPCPACAEELGHRVLAGKELYLDTLSME